MTTLDFLTKATEAARTAGHLYPEYAACEAALESAWGRSQLALQANNLFGQKQSHPPSGRSLALSTREFVHGAWVTIEAEWMCFETWEACFTERMQRLRVLAAMYPHYRLALAAATGEEFIAEVSKSWSTDPARAGKVLSVYREHFAVSQANLQTA